MKKRNLNFLSLALILGGGLFSLHADDTKLIIKTTSSSNPLIETQLSEVRKITFDANGINVISQAGLTAHAINYSEIKKIEFGNLGGVVNNLADITSARLYPNPATDLVNIEGVEAEPNTAVSIYSMAGEQVLSIKNWNGDAIDISTLPQNIYVLQVSNYHFKLIKR